MSETGIHWFTARKGAQLAWWQPPGSVGGIIEVHPDHPPIMHWFDGRDEEMKVIEDGAMIMVPCRAVPEPTFDIGSSNVVSFPGGKK